MNLIIVNSALPFVNNYLMQGFVWLVILVVVLIVEVIIKNSIALWFCPGAIICFLLTIFESKFVYQVLVFILLSSFLLIINHWNYLKDKTQHLRQKVNECIKSKRE